MSELAVPEGPDGSSGKSLGKLRNFQPQGAFNSDTGKFLLGGSGSLGRKSGWELHLAGAGI